MKNLPAPTAAAVELSTMTYETAFGTGLLVWRQDRLMAHTLPDPGQQPTAIPAIPANTATEPVPPTAQQQRLRHSLKAYFAGERIEFPADRLPIDWSSWSQFGQQVAYALASVPFGEVASYAEIAHAAGSPRACRAVGNFMAANPFPLLLPCHRIIRSDGHAGGFSAGLHWKKRLLRMEGIELPFRTGRLSNKL